MTSTTSILAGLGLLLIVNIAFRLIAFVQPYTTSTSKLDKYLQSAPGEPAWALVTGATAGIGRAVAHELAAAGFDIVLHGRNVPKLERVKSELRKAYPTRHFRILVVDAATCHIEPEAWMGEALALAQDINLKVLVNNVGGASNPIYDTLEQYDAKRILETIHLNAVFPTLLTSTLIPVLARNKPGLIINVGSLSDNGLPLLSFYAASKAYGSALSLSVAREMQLEHRDIEVITNRIGYTSQAGTNTDVEPHFFGPSATAMAKAILARVGCGRKSVVPYWTQALQQSMMVLMPDWLADRITISVMMGLRDEELAKRRD